MKQKILTAAAAMFVALGAQAAGGFVDNAASDTAPAVTVQTARQALQVADDQHVVLEGRITGRVGPAHAETYRFQDGSGSIRVEIDDDLWQGRTVSPDNTVRIWGEIDRKTNRPNEVDVERLEIVR